MHSRRTDPIKRSAYPFCQGERNEVGRSRMPIARTRALNATPNARSLSRMRYFGLLAYGSAFPRPPFALLEDGSSPHLASVSQEGRKDANVFVSSGVTWRILAYAVGFPCGLAANQDAGVPNGKKATRAASPSKRYLPR